MVSALCGSIWRTETEDADYIKELQGYLSDLKGKYSLEERQESTFGNPWYHVKTPCIRNIKDVVMHSTFRFSLV